MANKIKLIRLDGNDILSKSMETINQNYNLLEETINTQIDNSVQGLRVDNFNWETGTDTGPKGRITLSNGNRMTTESIPAADEGQSGIVTARTNQTISGVKRFTDGIKTDSIYSENGRKYVIASGNKVYIGGENGIVLEYEGNVLTNIIYGFSENGTTPGDIASQISSLQRLIDGNTSDIDSFNEALQNIINQYTTELQNQAGQLDSLASTLAELDFSDVREQLDGMIEHWFGPYEKMSSLLSGWGATVNMHVGDTFTVTEPDDSPYYKKCYKLRTDGSSYQWIEMNEDEYDAVIQALINTLDAISAADGKCTTFYSQYPPAHCHVGDIWITSHSFYMEGDTQNFNVEGIDDSDDIDVIPAHTIFFCIQDNETDYGNMSNWSKDIKTWAQIQFEKEVGKQFEITNEAIDSVADALEAINNDNIFSVFEKHDFLDHTWYLIAGSYGYIPNQGSITDGIPSSDFLGTTLGGSFRNTIKEYVGDNDTIQDTTDINELVNVFRNLGNWLMTNHLFDDQLDDTNFVITDENDYTTVVEYTGDDIGRKAKQQLAELLYNYYREEGECKKKAYVNAVTSMLYDLDSQEDNMIQNWFRNGVPTVQADMPWRKDGDDPAEYTIIDNMHISDTLVDLSSVERPVYKLSRRADEEVEIGDNNIAVTGTLFFWKRIGKSDLQEIIDQLNIDMNIAGGDGTINVFNTLPKNYSYGDIWFCRGEGQDDGYDNLSQADKNRFKAGCIYYCSAVDFEDGSDSDNERDLVRRYFVGDDWSNGYQQGEEIYSMFANMVSDGVLNPIEKSQIFMEWYEIGGFNLMGNDSELYDEIIEDVFLDDASNTGSFRCTVNNASKLLRNNQAVENYGDFNTFLAMDFDGSKHNLIQTISNLKTKLERLHSALVQCGCNDISTSTNLGELTFSGLGTPYDGPWNPSVHITMIPDLFSQYYLEEDNVKTWIQSIQAEELQDQIDDLGEDIDDINDIIGEVQNSIEAIEAINDDNIFSIYEKRTFLDNTWLMIAGSKTYSPSTDVSGYTTVSGVSVPDTDPTSIGNFLGTTTNGSFINTMNMCKGDRGFNNDDVKQCIGKLITAFKALGNWCQSFGLFDTPLTQSNWNSTSDKQTLSNLLYNYYNAEDECKRLSYVDAVTSLIQDLNGQGGENGDHMIQNWFGTVIPSSQGALPWRIASEQAADLNENDLKHKNDTFVHIIDGITEVYKFLEGTADTQNGDKGISGSPLYLKKIASADYQHIYDNLGIDTELAGADGSINIFNTLPHDYTYGDIWFCGEDYPSSNSPTFKNGCIYYCSNSALTTTPRVEFTASDWSPGYTYADSFISEFAHFTDDNWLTQIEKDQLLSKWHEIAGVDIFGNDSSLPGATLSDIFNNNQDSGGSFRSAVNLCTQLYDDIDSVGTYSAYDSLKTIVTEDYPELGTLITTLESKLTDVRNVLIACNCHIEGEQDLTTLSFSFTEASLNAYNGTWNSNKNGSMFSEIFTRYYLAESNVREKVQLIQNTNFQQQIDNFDARIDTAEDAINDVQSAIESINNDNIFSISEKNSFLTNTFLPISGNRAYDTSADVNYTTIGGTSCPSSRPTQISDFLGTSSNGSFIRTIDSIWPSSVSEVSDNVKVRVGELVSAYKNLAKLCKNNGLFETPLTSTQFRNSSNNPVDGPTGKTLLSEALYNYKREENECNKLLYIDAVSGMISSIANQLDGQVKRYYRNSTPPETIDGCSMLFGCEQDGFESHVNDEYIDTSSNNDVYLFTSNSDSSEIESPNIPVSDTNYYWKKVSNDDLQTLVSQIQGYIQQLAENDGVINVFSTVPQNYSYGDIWFCNSDYTSGNKTFEKDHMYWCFDTTAQNVSTFNPNHWKSVYPYGDEMLAQLAQITDDGYVSAIEKSSLIQKWCEIAGGGSVPASLNLSTIMNDSDNVGSFRSVISDWYSSFSTNSLNSTNYTSASQNSSSPHRDVVVNLVKKLNDIHTALSLCQCSGANATDGTSVENMTIPSGAFKYSGNMGFNGQTWSNSVLPTVFATYYFEETNLRTLVQQDNTQSTANSAAEAAANAAMQSLNNQLASMQSSINSLQSQIDGQAGQGTTPVANDNEFTVSEKTEFLHNTWQTIAGSLTYVSGNDGSSYISNGKLTGEYLGTSSSSNGSFRTTLKDIDGFTISGGKVTNTGLVATLITKFKDLAAECNEHGLFTTPLASSTFPSAGQPHDIDDLYDALYQYYNAEESLRQHNYSEDYSNVMAAINNQTDSVIRTHYASVAPPNTVDGVLGLWKEASDIQEMSASEKTNELIDHNFDEYTNLSVPVTYLLVTDESMSPSEENEDIEINDTNYFWKKISQSNISDIISQFGDAYDELLARTDGFIQVFGPDKLPEKYDYGDIWFFGGVDFSGDELTKYNSLSPGDKNKLNNFVTGNVYYCNQDYPDSEVDSVQFDPDDWVVGSNSGSLTTQLTQMTSDGWMTYSEKYVLRQKWYEITGFEFGTRSFNSFDALKNFFSNNTNLTNLNGTFKQAKLQYDNIISEYGGSEPGGGNSGGNSGGSEAPADPSGGETGEGEQNENIQGMLDGIFINDGNSSMDTSVLKCEKSEIDGEYHLIVEDDEYVLRVLCSYQRWDESIVENDGSDLKSITMVDFDENNDETFAKYVKILEIRFVRDIDNYNDTTIKLDDDIFTQGDIGVKFNNSTLEVISESGKLKSYIYGIGSDPHEIEDSHKFSVSIGDNEYDMYVCVDSNDGNSGALNIQNVENCMSELYDDIWNIYKVMDVCGCGDMDNPTNLHTNVPGGLKSPFDTIQTSHYIYNENHVNDHRTLVADVFTQYYTDEQVLYVEMTEYQISNIEVYVDPLEGLANDDDEGEGLILTSYIKLKYNGEVTGGLSGVNEEGEDLGLWLGGSYEDAKNDNDNVPINLKRTGYGSRIGPLVVGGSAENPNTKTLSFGDERTVYKFSMGDNNYAGLLLTTENHASDLITGTGLTASDLNSSANYYVNWNDIVNTHPSDINDGGGVVDTGDTGVK